MPTVTQLIGQEILDSRGRPTVKATCRLDSGAAGSASVPSGRSTGTAEAVELRDGDEKRYRGLGCRKAAANVSGEISDAAAKQTFDDQAAFDQMMIDLDGTANKGRLGANAILACSIAFARACAAERGVPLYQQFADILGQPLHTQPRLTINLFSGGKHAGKQVAIQDVLIVPVSPTTIDGSLVMMYEIYHAAVDMLAESQGMRWLTADEGGLGPDATSADELLQMAVDAMQRAGCEPGVDAAIAVDVASSHFYDNGRYEIDGDIRDGAGMVETIAGWVERYPVVSVEDGLFEDDWDSWPGLCERIGDRALVVGDDLLCTNPQRIKRAIETNACNALLLKVNQVGTLTESAEAYRLARSAGWGVTISVRSGETEDDWAADLVVGWGGDQFKNGSIAQSERLAKYNRLLEIEQEIDLPIITWPNG